ncbi:MULTISPECIES: hypothetical protein [Halomonadaceae]|uniref:hypothetical protein n=1 Tax=Halomonadaceae TaxID=28256 RepID=UPI0015841986|nr:MULTISPECIES: hypothetical protein [Halomonas]MDI4636694.1 hypothetical protein [Halomonas sp. BMC7]NUJ61059.1 hypothetical protein [Halomonas taeanensis]
MPTALSLELCYSLTKLTRQLLEAGKHTAETHVLSQGRVYRVALTLEPVPIDQLPDVIQRYR